MNSTLRSRIAEIYYTVNKFYCLTRQSVLNSSGIFTPSASFHLTPIMHAVGGPLHVLLTEAMVAIWS